MPDLDVLCRDLDHGQFANLRSLILGGNGIHGTNYLDIDVLGEARYIPNWTSLEKSRLKNVYVSVRTIGLLRKQELHLEIRHAIWRYPSFLEFQAGTMLYSAKLTSIYRRCDVLNNDTVKPVTAPPSFHLQYYPPNAWIVAESSTEAEKIGPVHDHGDVVQ